MGICMKDHPAEDILDKLEEVRDQLEENVVAGLTEGLEQKKWGQGQLNELFHALKKLEKNITEQERKETLELIKLYSAA